MPVRRWGALLLVALFFLAGTAQAWKCPTHGDRPDGQETCGANLDDGNTCSVRKGGPPAFTPPMVQGSAEEKDKADEVSHMSTVFGGNVASASETLSCFKLFKNNREAQVNLTKIITNARNANGNKSVDLAIVYDALYALFYGMKYLPILQVPDGNKDPKVIHQCYTSLEELRKKIAAKATTDEEKGKCRTAVMQLYSKHEHMFKPLLCVATDADHGNVAEEDIANGVKWYTTGTGKLPQQIATVEMQIAELEAHTDRMYYFDNRGFDISKQGVRTRIDAIKQILSNFDRDTKVLTLRTILKRKTEDVPDLRQAKAFVEKQVKQNNKKFKVSYAATLATKEEFKGIKLFVDVGGGNVSLYLRDPQNKDVDMIGSFKLQYVGEIIPATPKTKKDKIKNIEQIAALKLVGGKSPEKLTAFFEHFDGEMTKAVDAHNKKVADGSIVGHSLETWEAPTTCLWQTWATDREMSNNVYQALIGHMNKKRIEVIDMSGRDEREYTAASIWKLQCAQELFEENRNVCFVGSGSSKTHVTWVKPLQLPPKARGYTCNVKGMNAVYRYTKFNNGELPSKDELIKFFENIKQKLPECNMEEALKVYALYDLYDKLGARAFKLPKCTRTREEMGKLLEDDYKRRIEIAHDVAGRPLPTTGIDAYERNMEGADRNEHTIRIQQYNILAHGLASMSSGLANIFNEDVTDNFVVNKDGGSKDESHLTDETLLTEWLRNNTNGQGKKLTINMTTKPGKAGKPPVEYWQGNVFMSQVIGDIHKFTCDRGCHPYKKKDVLDGRKIKNCEICSGQLKLRDLKKVVGDKDGNPETAKNILKDFQAWFCQNGRYWGCWEDLIEKPLLNVLTGRTFETPDGGVTYPDGKRYVPPRFNRVLGQTLKQSPDIISYQELDHFEYFEGILGNAGYKGHFFQKRKTQSYRFNGRYSQEKGKLDHQEGGGHDGAALFWDKSKFECQGTPEAITINMTLPKDKNKQVCGRVILKRKGDGQIFAVYAAHMKSGGHKDKAEKEHQATQIAANILAYKKEHKEHAIIFAADFNCHNKATPKEKAKKEDGSTPHTVFHNTLSGTDYQNLRSSWMESTYKTFYGQEPDFTTAKWRKGGEQLGKIENKKDDERKYGKGTFGKETEDYIFVSEHNFRVKAALSIPTYEQIGHNLLLNWQHPSDHFDIAVDIEYIKKPEGGYPYKNKLSLRHPEPLADHLELEVGTRVTCADAMTKILGQYREEKIIVAAGETGIIAGKAMSNHKMRIKVKWDGGPFKNAEGRREMTKKYDGWMTELCNISGYALKAARRRRMAQREFSDRRDSPVMVRLLQEIIDAQDK